MSSELRRKITEATLPLTPDNVQAMIDQLTREDMDLILHYHAEPDSDPESEEGMCEEIYTPEHVRYVFVHALELLRNKLAAERVLPQ